MDAASLTQAFRQLLKQGFIADKTGKLAPWLQGLAHPAEPNHDGWLLSEILLNKRQQLSSDGEWVLALLTLNSNYRNPWLKLMAARCREAGLIAEPQVLIKLITDLGAVAQWITPILLEASLSKTATADLEREWLGHGLNENAAIPALTRILKTGYELCQQQGQNLPTLPLLDSTGEDIQRNWRSGRLLALPGKRIASPAILQGAGKNSAANDFDWLLVNPWALLLTMLIYAQDTWAAEGYGGLVLELSDGQAVHNPSHIQVLVQDSEGSEVLCGSLAELLLKVLNHCQMALYPQTPLASELDQALSTLIGEMLQRRIWRYREGGSGRRGQYRIDPRFADDCYRLGPSRVFNRSGKHLWQAVRLVAEQWYRQRLALSSGDSHAGEFL